MKLNKIIQEFNIKQKYNINNLFFNNLQTYENMLDNTIFYCNTPFDFQFLNLHKGDIYMYIDSKNYKNVLQKYNQRYNLLTDDKTIYEKIKNKFNIILFDTTLVNIYNINVIQNNILFVINATNKYNSRYKKLLKFLKNFTYDYYIVQAGSDTIILKDKILHIDVEDIYENLSKKLIKAYRYIYNNTSYTHIYKVDDDFFELNINMDNLYQDYYGNYIIKNLKKDYHFGKCDNDKYNNTEYQGDFIYKYAAGGYGYILSRKSLYYLIYNTDYICNEIYEDKAIGDVLYKNNIIVNDNHNNDIIYKKPEPVKIIKKNINKCSVIFFHKNLKKIYEWKWIEKCVLSVLNQTYNDFDIFEINYGGDSYSIFNDITTDKNLYFYKESFETHTEAMMYLLDICFNEYDYDIVYNTNLDDYYRDDRFMLQKECIENGYDLCSSYMTYIDGDDNITMVWDDSRYGFNKYGFINNGKYVDNDNIKKQLDINHNIINHSCVCFSKNFWNSYDKNNNLLRYRDDKPYEDLSLWQRGLTTNITIITENLIYYRIHNNQIGEQNKKESKDDNVDGGFMPNPSNDKHIIGIFCICTGNYVQYLNDLVSSVNKYFLPKYNKVFFISTDNKKYVDKLFKKYDNKYFVDVIYKKGFPLDTLYRYKYLLNFGIKVEMYCDYIYYLDVDMRIVDNIGDEILPNKDTPLVGTKHPGFAFGNNKNGSPETREISTAYISPENYRNIYIAGGFNGGYSYYFRQMAKEIQKNIDIDKSNDIIAVWHDESHLNKYMNINFDMFKILEPDYCYPENYHENIPCSQKILALDKDHNKVRNILNKKMILVNVLGGLGNLLFQTFYAYAIAMRYNLDVVIKYDQIDESRESIYHYHLFDNIFRVSKLDYSDTISEQTKNYSELTIPFNKNLYLTGYFQSTLYFRDYFENIMKVMNLDIYYKINKLNKQFFSNKYIALHIRGGDYIEKSDYHKLMPESYYVECLSKIENIEEYKIILFTDDYEYCDKFSINYNYKATDLITNVDDYLQNMAEVELYLMSMCDIIICANSTFSLWASYFGNYFKTTKKTFIPKEWFGPKGPQDFTTEEFKLNETYISI